MASEIDQDFAAWATERLAPGGTLVSARGLRDGGAPWLVTAMTSEGSDVEAVLRVGPAGESEDIRVDCGPSVFLLRAFRFSNPRRISCHARDRSRVSTSMPSVERPPRSRCFSGQRRSSQRGYPSRGLGWCTATCGRVTQGRPELSREVMLPRREEFLQNALRHFD